VANITGGTGLIIVIGVFLDLMKQIESQLLMRHYEGFDLKKKSHRRWEFRPTAAGS
jgi:preprotein translocase subunit SecY